jgi:hypothetical protein
MADDFEGFQRLANLLEEYSQNANPANILQAQKAGAEYFCEVMRRKASPRGRSREHMLDSVAYDQDARNTETVVGWGKFYGRMVESGHRAGGWAKASESIAAHPHMKPEFNKQKDQIMSRMVAVLKG